MGLKLNRAPAAAGMRWVGLGLAEYLRQPMAYSLLFVVFFLALLLVGIVPVVGAGFLLLGVPLLSLGFMMATHGATRGQAPQPAVFLAPWRQPRPDRRRPLVALLLLHGTLMAATVWLGESLSNGGLGEWFAAYAQGNLTVEELNRLAAAPGMTAGALATFGGVTLVSLLYWFAPALAVWAGQGVAQALFSSALALWRSRWAFLNYAVVWLGLVFALLVLANLLGLLVGPALAALLVLPLNLALTCTFYISLYFSFVDCFGEPLTPAAG